MAVGSRQQGETLKADLADRKADRPDCGERSTARRTICRQQRLPVGPEPENEKKKRERKKRKKKVDSRNRRKKRNVHPTPTAPLNSLALSLSLSVVIGLFLSMHHRRKE